MPGFSTLAFGRTLLATPEDCDRLDGIPPLMGTNEQSRTYCTLSRPEKEPVPAYTSRRRSDSHAPMETMHQCTSRLIANTVLFALAAYLLLATIAVLLMAIFYLVLGREYVLENFVPAFSCIGGAAFAMLCVFTTVGAVVENDFRLALRNVFLSLEQGIVGMGLMVVAICMLAR